jgi:hypothetical protein
VSFPRPLVFAFEYLLKLSISPFGEYQIEPKDLALDRDKTLESAVSEKPDVHP